MADYVHLDIDVILKETDAAFLVLTEDDDELWLPKSQISDPDDYDVGDTNVTISITKWLADQKGIEVD